jgi:hypothetical protein
MKPPYHIASAGGPGFRFRAGAVLAVAVAGTLHEVGLFLFPSASLGQASQLALFDDFRTSAEGGREDKIRSQFGRALKRVYRLNSKKKLYQTVFTMN